MKPWNLVVVRRRVERKHCLFLQDKGNNEIMLHEFFAYISESERIMGSALSCETVKNCRCVQTYRKSILPPFSW
jgi:hypothetical protein